MRFCKFFVKGYCARGTDCAYEHDKPSSQMRAEAFVPSRQPRSSSNRPPYSINQHVNSMISSNFATCRFYAKGSCKFGTKCKFKHTDIKQILSGKLFFKSIEMKVLIRRRKFKTGTRHEIQEIKFRHGC